MTRFCTSSGFLPTEDQGYGILLARLPQGASQPRARELAEKINGILGHTNGVANWVTIGGFSLLDGANVTSMVVIPPPIRGLGQTGGFQMMMEDRGNLGCTAHAGP